MEGEAKTNQGGLGEMNKRRTTLEDGRYLIYYTFGDEPDEPRGTGGSASKGESESESKREPDDVEPFAEEERRV